MPDWTCVDLTDSWGAAFGAAFLLGRIALLAIDRYGLQRRSKLARAFANHVGTVLGGKAARHAKDEE